MGPALAMHVDLLLLSSNLSELGFRSQNDGVHNEKYRSFWIETTKKWDLTIKILHVSNSLLDGKKR
jgi:hypothetical protein